MNTYMSCIYTDNENTYKIYQNQQNDSVGRRCHIENINENYINNTTVVSLYICITHAYE